MVCTTLYPIARYFDVTIDVPTLVALLVCLIPTTIGALLAAIGIAGMARLSQANVMAMSGRAVEAAGDVDVLLLDKTGTITLGNRQASEFRPAPGVDERQLADAAQLASLADETPEGRSIVVLAKERFNIRGRELEAGAGRVCELHGPHANEWDQPRRVAAFARVRPTSIRRFVRRTGRRCFPSRSQTMWT